MIWNKPNTNSKKNDSWSNKLNKVNKKEGKIKIFFKIKKILFNCYTKIFCLKDSYNSLYKVKLQIVNIIIVSILAWIISGFYIIKNAERGVIITFGKLNHIIYPGLHWKRTFIDQLKIVNVKTIRELTISGIIFTADANMVKIKMNVLFRVVNPKEYLFSSVDPKNSLRQLSDSTLKKIIGYSKTSNFLIENHIFIKRNILTEIRKIMQLYKIGIYVLDVDFQKKFFPKKDKFFLNNSIVLAENQKQYLQESEMYINEVQTETYKKSYYILKTAVIFKKKNIFTTQQQIIQLFKIMSQYPVFKKIVCQNLILN